MKRKANAMPPLIMMWLSGACALFSCANTSISATITTEQLSSFNKANAAWVAGDATQTRLALEPVVRANPDFVAARFLLAKALYCNKDYPQAGIQFHEVLRQQATNLSATVWLARTLVQEGLLAEAEKLVMDGLQANPDYPGLTYMMATLCENKNDITAALAYLQTAEQLEEDLSLIYLESARLRWRIGDGTAAKQRLEKAKFILPKTSSLSGALTELLDRFEVDRTASWRPQ